jgi:lipopolysaccharide/colanic/teichoic acid biosynthesis glycosyltransferase
VAGRDGAAHRLLQAELEAHLELAEPRSGTTQLVLDDLPDARAFLHHDQRFAPQLVERDRLACETVIGRAGEHDLVAEEGLEADAAVATGGAHDPELDLAPGNPVDHGLRVGHGEAESNSRMRASELAEQDRNDCATRAGRGAELERSGQTSLVAGHVAQELLLEREQALGRGVQARPCFGRFDPATRTVEELRPDALFERPDLEANRRLGDTQPFRGLGEALAIDDRTKCGELAGVHKHSLCAHRLYDRWRSVATPNTSFSQRFPSLTETTPRRGRDGVLRALDVSLSAFFLLVSLPFTVPIALLLLATGGTPLFYRGERVGRAGAVFQMLKFRTLERGAETRLGPFLGEELVRRTKDETTRLGGWLRATQLDEAPQLWNVLRGDMSLVGPRPIRPRFFEELVADLPAYWQRLVVRPGLTGFAQVRRGYETSMAEKLAHDLEWIADRSVRLYLRTLATTAWRVLGQFARGLAGRGR